MMEVVKKFQGTFRRVREQLNRWDGLQSCLISQFRSASHIIDRLQVLQNSNCYGGLNCDSDVRDALVVNQIKSVDNILVSMRSTLEEFHHIVLFLEKIHRDSRQLVKGSSSHPIMKHLQQRVGIKPSLIDCLDGLLFLHDIHHSEYLLKSAIISALSAIALKPRASDLGALQQLLVDQPNVLSEEGMQELSWGGTDILMINNKNVCPCIHILNIGHSMFNMYLTSYLLKNYVDDTLMDSDFLPGDA